MTHTPSTLMAVRRTSRSPRGAFTVVELTLSVALAAVFCVILAPIAIGTAHQRRLIVQEQLALSYLGNVLEELSQISPDKLPEKLTQYQQTIPESVRQALPHAEMNIEQRAESGSVPAMRITCQLRWRDRHGQWTKPLTLTGWNHSISEGLP